MKVFSTCALLFISLCSVGQVTQNPKVTRKSSSDTFINKIEITEEYTVVSMQFVSANPEDQLKEYLNANPEEKQQLAQMDPMMRNLILRQMMERMGQSTISIQPGSYLKARDGRQFKFIKATSIPVAPERKQVEPGKKYFFKVYFDRLAPGIQQIDLIENKESEADGFHYWNFYGIEVNNPGKGETDVPRQLSETSEISSEELTFLLSGKVFNAETNLPVAAKIVCKIEGKDVPFDSLYTSKSGYYEFLLKPEAFVYEISAEGYKTYEQSLDLSKWKKDLQQDFFLEPVNDARNTTEYEESATPETLEMVDNQTIRLNNVYFPTGKAEIYNKSYRELDEVVKMMQNDSTMKIRVEGHTDNQGDSELNKKLSLDRAIAVKNYLTEHGIDSLRITCEGFGDTRPIVSNDNASDRQKNRRVEIRILQDEDTPTEE